MKSGDKIFRLTFFVPVKNAEEVKQAIFSAGAGDYGNYDCCSWETLGTGQFRPGTNSTPAIGSRGEITRVPELRIETICRGSLIPGVLQKLIESHPYEVPAYAVDEIYFQENSQTTD